MPEYQLRFMFLEPLEPNWSLVTWSVVLMEEYISIWNDSQYVRVQLVRIIFRYYTSFLVCSSNSTAPETALKSSRKYNIAITNLCMICCISGEQLFASKSTYSDLFIAVLNKESRFIRRPVKSHPQNHGSVMMFLGTVWRGWLLNGGSWVGPLRYRLIFNIFPLNGVLWNT